MSQFEKEELPARLGYVIRHFVDVRLRGTRAVPIMGNGAVTGLNYLGCDYILGYDITRDKLVVDFSFPADKSENQLPSINRVEELLQLSKKIQLELGLNPVKINRSESYIGKGSIDLPVDDQKIVCRKLRIAHDINKARKQFNPAELSDAVFDLSFRPLGYLAQR